MSAVRQVGIKMVVDAQSVTTELPKAAREFTNLGNSAEQGAARATRSLAQVSMSVRDIVQGAAGLHLVGQGIESISSAITSLPRQAFDFSKNLEVSQLGMAGILGSMTAINGQQLDYNRALQLSGEYIKKLNDDALRTAATSQELTQVFQALLAPGLAAKMNLEEIRQLTVVGTNAVKSMGLDATQVVQELRDLVAGGITPASSTLASALGLKDSDIAKAKASSEGLFKFLMDRLQGFQAASDAFGDTFKGRLETIKEGATRVAAEGMEPLITASKAALGEISALFTTVDKSGEVKLNQGLVDSIKEVSQMAVTGISALRSMGGLVYEHRDAVTALAVAYGSIKLVAFVAEMAKATAAKVEALQASRLAAVQAAAEAAGNVEVAATSRQKVAAYLAELSAKVANAEADVAAQTARLATLATTQDAIVVARADVVAKLEAVRATMAQAEAQIAAARAAGALSFALAAVREGTDALAAAQARHAVLVTELATLGRQQAGVQASIAAATTAQTAAQNAAAASATQLAAAQNAASVTGRALGGVLGLMGGWVGLLTTAVTVGATVWATWGNAGADAERKTQSAVARSTQEILADLDRQIAKLNQRNALVGAGMGELAKQGGEAAERMGELQQIIEKLQSQKGGNQTEEVRRLDDIRKAQAEYGQLQQRVNMAADAQERLNKGSGQLTLTATGAEQAWRKSIDGVKTAISIQEEYDSKLRASRTNFASFEAAKPDPEKLRRAQEEQQQYEKGLAQERDKQIKELGAGAATARTHAIDAEIAATKHGYKLLAAETAGSLADVEAQRKLGQLSDSDALERRTALQLADIDAQRAALQSGLELLKGRKDSAKEQANIQGELAELTQKRANVEAQAAREQRELDAQAADELERRITAEQAAAAQSTENLRVAKLDTLEIGKTGEALGALRQARVEDAAAALERRAVTMDGIDLSGRASAALRKQAQDMRDLAKVQGYNEAARMVHDYAKAIDEANAATQFELSLSTMSQREREIALEQYRIAIDLKKRLEEIDASNPADAEAAAKLKADAQAAAARAQAGAQQRVLAREWQRTVDQIDDVFRQGFADMLNQGEEGWKAFTKSLSTTFKTTVANEMYKAFAQPFVVNLIGNLMGLTGLGGLAQVASGGGNLLGLASNASSLYNLGGQAAGWLGGLFGGGSAGLGLASTTGAGYALSGAGSGLGLSAGVGSGGFFGGGGLGLSAGSAGAGSIGAGLGTGAASSTGASSMLAAIPGWGWALAGLATVAALVGKFDKSGTPHWGAAAEYDGTTLTGGNDVFVRSGTAGRYTQGAQAGVDAVARAVGDTLNGLGKALGKGGNFGVMTAYSDDSSDDPGFGSLRISRDGQKLLDWEDSRTSKWAPKIFADGEEGWKMYLSAIAKDTRQVLLDMDLPSWANTLLEGIGDSASMEDLSAVVAQIGLIAQAFEDLGRKITGFAGLTDTAFERILTASGGIEALGQNAASFYEGFYSETERRDIAKREINDRLAALGVSVDLDASNARELYRKIVEDMLAAANGDDAAAQAAAELLALSEAIKSVTAASTDSAEAVTRAAKAEADARRSATDAALQALERAVAAERDAIQARVDAAQERVNQERAIVDLTRDQVRELRGTVDATAAMAAARAQRFIGDAITAASTTGYLPDQAELSRAIDAVRGGMGESAYASRLEWEEAQLKLALQLETLGAAAGDQLSVDEQALETAQEQLRYLDDLLVASRAEIDAVRGTTEAVLGVTAAVDALRAAILEEKEDGEGKGGGDDGGGSGGGKFAIGGSGPGDGGGGYVPETEAEKILRHFKGFDPSSTDDLLKAYNMSLFYDWSIEDIADAYGVDADDMRKLFEDHGIPAFARGGSHLGGVRLVGEEGPELEVTGASRIYSAGQTRDMLSQIAGGGSSTEMARAMERLALAVESQGARLGDIGQHTRDTADVLLRVTRGAQAMQIAGSASALELRV